MDIERKLEIYDETIYELILSCAEMCIDSDENLDDMVITNLCNMDAFCDLSEDEQEYLEEYIAMMCADVITMDTPFTIQTPF